MEQIEVVKQYLAENGTTIVNYALMALAYFLVFLFKSKVNDSGNMLTTLFKERSATQDAAFNAFKAVMEEQVAVANKAYQDAIDTIAEQKDIIERTNKALAALLGAGVATPVYETDPDAVEENNAEEVKEDV